MRQIPFVKYTCYGNNFVIVDQADKSCLSEEEMSVFARAATDTAFGVGCDNLLVVQRCNKETLENIARARGYWTRLPDPNRADFIFRMFESDGQEAFCCGNGLACVADYLGQHHQQASVSILTEVPLQRPSTLRIGSIRDGNTSWVDLGPPRRNPEEVVTPGSSIPYANSIDLFEDIVVELPAHALEPFTCESTLNLSGYIIFTGEPHLVVYPDEIFAAAGMADSLFEARPGDAFRPGAANPQLNFGTRLIEHIGLYLNHQCRHMFPAGVSVNFARLHADNVVEYRCFERGIERETLACGTGALACAYVSTYLRGVEEQVVNVFPHRCRWYDTEARIQVSRDRAVWLLESSPTMLFKGSYVAVQQALQSVQSEQEKDAKRSAAESASESEHDSFLMAAATAASL